MKPITLHPSSMLAGAAVVLLAFVAMGQMQVTGYQAQVSSARAWPPHPRQMVTLDSTAHPSGSPDGGIQVVGLGSVVIHTVPLDRWLVLSSIQVEGAGAGQKPFHIVEGLGSTSTTKHGAPFLLNDPDGTPLGTVFSPGSQVLVANYSSNNQELKYHVEGYYALAD